MKVSTTWLTNASDSVYEMNCHTIVSALTGSTIFPTPNPPIPELMAIVTAFAEASSRAKDGGKAETAAKNAARLTCSAAMRNVGQYIDATATTLEEFLSSKYPLQKERSPIGIQPAPYNFRTKHGKVSGSLDASCEANEHRVLYEWQTAVGQNPTEWSTQPTTNSCRTSFSGFSPGSWVNSRCRIRVPAGAGDWSSVGQIMMV